MEEKETIVMSVGGSLIVPEEIDTAFLTNLKQLLEAESQNNRRFIIITGGGRTSRRYAAAAEVFSHISQTEVDEIGIEACQLNAALMKLILKDIDVQINPDRDLYAPGSSSDRAAVRTAVRHSAHKVINLSNISHVYTADPRTDPSAQKIEDITWSEFRTIIPAEFTPNLSSPFDPEAAKEAEEHAIEVATISGENLEELKKYLNGDSFIGTKIHK